MQLLNQEHGETHGEIRAKLVENLTRSLDSNIFNLFWL